MKTENRPTGTTASLFPYIKTESSGISIDFIPAHSPPDDYRPAFPFETLEHPDPLACLVKANLVTDAGSKIEQLFILLQRDQVQHLNRTSLPGDNPATSQCWQRAFSNFSNNQVFDDCLLKLGDQITDDGRLLPFQPLLYCSLKKQFFPPLCPLCGGELDLCRDDDMLDNADLHPYTHSLRRYLFCPTCYQLAGETDFYTCLSNNIDEKQAKSLVELINGFRKLAASTSQTHRFPCRQCPQVSDCHAPDGPLLGRISPFAFYPFYMLIFKAASVDSGNLFICKEAKKDSSSRKAKREPAEPVEDQNKTISTLLKHLIGKWEMEIAKNKEKTPLIESAERPSRIPPVAPSGEPSTPISKLNENPDLQETIVVSAKRNRPKVYESPSPPVHEDMPETIIVGAKVPAKPEDSHQLEPTGGDPHHPSTQTSDTRSSNTRSPDTIAPQQSAGMLPETMIIRPPQPNTPTGQDQQVPSKITPKWPSQSGPDNHQPNKKSLLDTIDPPGPRGSFYLKNKPPDNAPKPEKKFLKTFILGSNKNNLNAAGKNRSASSPNRNKPRMPLQPNTENELAETIIVSPQKKDKDRK